MAASTTTDAASARDLTKKITLPIDLRSDTVTKPTPEMRRAMAEAEVGDDVYAEDPSVNHLQKRAAEIFRREAAIFLPTGSMGNLIAIKIWTHHGDEVICEDRGHIYQYEMAAMSSVAGCIAHPLNAPRGILTWKMIEPHIRPHIYDYSQTRLISLENTHNMAGGTVYPQEICDEICDRAHDAGLRVHLDGARIFNAATALGKDVAAITRKFDSVMFCLSKGLAAPVGSMLVGSADFIEKARILRKMYGGGMRQAGVIAAAGLIALEKMPARLHEDHANAKFLAEGLSRIPGLHVDVATVQTNMVFADVSGTGKTGLEACAAMRKHGVIAGLGADNYSIRMVTHCDVDRTAIEHALEIVAVALKN
jgi:threonine aldolase